MTHAAKLLWGEGLFLRPQHFQRQDAYHEARLHEMSRALHPYAWGVRRIRIDRQSLASGVLRMIDLSVIFPDGELYAAPDVDELPTPMALDTLPDNTRELIVYLALPLLREHGSNCAQDTGDNAARYLQQSVTTPDLYSDADAADISFLKKSVRLLGSEQSRDAFVTVPLLKIARPSTGGFEQDTTFLPATLSLQGCPELVAQLRRLLDALQAKAQALVGLHREPSQHIIEFRSGDVASFWLLHTVNAASAALTHLYQHPGFPPERLHQELARLAGGLLTFSPSYRLADLPAYDHVQPGAGFQRLFEIVHELIDTVISTRYVAITLSEARPSYHLGHLDSQRIDEKSTFYLAVRAAMPPAELVDLVPLQFKVGAPDDVDKAVLSALPGVRLSHQPQVPAAIPVRPGAMYFALDARGPLYERMLKSQSIMIYVPSGLPELKLELMAVLP